MSKDLIAIECLDSDELADARKKELHISREYAFYRTRLVKTAVEIGTYDSNGGKIVDWRQEIIAACLSKKSIPPWQELPPIPSPAFDCTRVQVTNETTLGAALRLIDQGKRPLVLNFANGTSPGGGFLTGANAQEESLCRCSSLYWTLVSDPMYLHHAYLDESGSTDWAIVSPMVPFFCTDAADTFDKPVLIDIITAAAPYAPSVGQPRSRELLQARIYRILQIAAGLNYHSLVLGAWGCGAFMNDSRLTAEDFKAALSGAFKRQFSDVVFAIADWSPQRKYLAPFRDVFATN
ncbi:TIGR02452 family protein [Pirellulaceae bacterium SH449]